MIEIYDSQNTNYSKNGDMLLEPTKCELIAELNGEIRIELTHKYDDLGRWKYLQEENVIACPVPWSEKQFFRIYKKVKQKHEIVVYAYHIFYDLRNKIIIDARPTTKNGEEALNIILAGTGYKGHSNIAVTTTAYYIRKNVVAAICGDEENSFLNRWGGEMLPDNFDLYIYNKIGENRGVKVKFGYNLTGIQETVDMSEVITRIIPVGYNGITLNGSQPWVDSPNINKYAQVYERVITYEEIRVKENDTEEEGYDTLEEAQQALEAAAQQDFEGGIDEPTVNYVVNMALLENTEMYKQYKELSKVTLGDTVECSHTKIDIEVEARCIKITWDCIQKRTKEIELGKYINTYFDDQRNTNNKLTVAAGNTYTKEQVNEMINRYLDDTKNFVTEEKLEQMMMHYVTETMINDVLKEYATIEAMNEAIQSITNGGITGEYLQKKLEEYVKTETLKQELTGYVGNAEYKKKIEDIELRLTQIGG